ncbi:glycosyltransferase family 4 protein [Nodosilinea sp. LEGE 07088]|uniref:glycosyltransferase family 4 protein n=1 Tax=Nodosilinea sp. LEGE 07088 TaxID=2777968 RepID=UPI001882DE4D|nr:glycosyltransferase family 4 protein [Nodosilinea sp. LEGE 07088]MBE9138987.1 glycosyltransferase family 4 protein [Nodosilinea sp. LEGE 07088]
MPFPTRRLLLVSTPVGPLGSGLGGGVELTLLNLYKGLTAQGHHITVLAPEGSHLGDVPIVEIAGQLQPTAHTQGRDTPIVLPSNSVLGQMWCHARQHQDQYDLIVNLAYDWLPFYLTEFFATPVAHFVTMGSLSDAMDAAIHRVAHRFPHRLGAYTRTQAETFGVADAFEILSSAVDLDLYQFCPTPGNALAWLGRISPEKGLEDALEAATIAQAPLKILGKLEDADYWQQLCQRFPSAVDSYLGFLPTHELQQVLRQCRALVMTPRWVEAFGNVAIEALACGVPVIAYQRGGPTEIVQPGKTGWLVAPDHVPGLVDAIANIDSLDRHACRHQAETDYSLSALTTRFECWFETIITAQSA